MWLYANRAAPVLRRRPGTWASPGSRANRYACTLQPVGGSYRFTTRPRRWPRRPRGWPGAPRRPAGALPVQVGSLIGSLIGRRHPGVDDHLALGVVTDNVHHDRSRRKTPSGHRHGPLTEPSVRGLWVHTVAARPLGKLHETDTNTRIFICMLTEARTADDPSRA